MPTLTNVTFPNHEIFNKTVKAIKESTATEVLIERAIGRRLPRITVPDFDYRARAEVQLEMPHAERIAQIRARKAEERQRAKANAERRAAAQAAREAAEARKAAAPGGHHGSRPRTGGGNTGGRSQRRRPHRGGRRPEG